MSAGGISPGRLDSAVTVLGWVGSGCGLEGDGVAEGFELADVASFAAFGVDAGGVEVGAEIVETCGVLGEQVPDDDQQGSADRDDGFLAATSAGDAPVPFPEEGVGLAGGGRGVAQDPGQVGVAVAGGVLA